MEPIRILQYFPNKMERGGIEAYLLGNHRNIDRSKIQFDYIVGSSEPGVYDEEITSLGGKIYRFDGVQSVSFYKKLFKGLKKDGYRIVHFHCDDFGTKAILGAYLAGIPVRISNSHNNMGAPGFKGKIKRYFTTKFSNYHLAVSREAGDWLFGKKKYRLHNIGIAPHEYAFSTSDREQIRKELGIKDTDKVIGCVGHLLESHKNQGFLLDLLSYMRNPEDLHLILVGDGVNRPDLEKKVNDLNLKNVHFVGSKPANAYLSAFDAFVLPSIHEGFPLSRVEAIANGLRCVLSEGVPPSASLSEYEKRISLDAPVLTWAEALEEAISKRDFSGKNPIIGSEYDIAITSAKLASFYMNCYDGLKKK